MCLLRSILPPPPINLRLILRPLSLRSIFAPPQLKNNFAPPPPLSLRSVLRLGYASPCRSLPRKFSPVFSLSLSHFLFSLPLFSFSILFSFLYLLFSFLSDGWAYVNEQRTYSGRRGNVHPTCETFKQRVPNVYIAYWSVRCYTLKILNMSEIKNRPQRTSAFPSVPMRSPNEQLTCTAYAKRVSNEWQRKRTYTPNSKNVGHTLLYTQMCDGWGSVETCPLNGRITLGTRWVFAVNAEHSLDGRYACVSFVTWTLVIRSAFAPRSWGAH